MKYHVLMCAGWVLLAALLIVPVELAYRAMMVGQTAGWVVLGSVGWVLLILALSARPGWRWLTGLLVLVVIGLTAVRALYLGLVQFSGFGFTPEFFLHLEPESLRVAWADFRTQVLMLLLLLLAVAMLLSVLLRGRKTTIARGPALLLAAFGVFGLVSARAVLPEWQLLRAWQDWRQPAQTAVAPATLAAWQQAGILNTEFIDKADVRVVVPAKPKNLVLVYLESVGLALIDHPRWPGLMPHLSELVRTRSWVDHLETSAYITMEGIANSQCGTLLPFSRNSDSLASGNRLFENLPCLGDVLATAGYQQVYLGGAVSEFAGKGEFLSAHGFGDVRGFEYWQQHGFTQRVDSWGLSDVELFAQATLELQRLHAEARPFNMTLLTIGTHLPGFSYQECAPYRDGNRPFLNAAHCTDQLLSAWLDQARAQGLFKDTVVVITADHHIFPSPLMHELFGDAADDRRLPLVVLGDDLPVARQRRGASYDLAPSVLGLLGVQSNAGFMLGRSLLDDIRRPPWLFSRYFDVAPGARVENNPARCEGSEGKVMPPFDACGKRVLIDALAGIADRFSRIPAQLSCTPAKPTRFSLRGAAPDQGFQAQVGGVDQSTRFSHDGYAVPAGSAGIYALIFGRHGRLRRTQFVAESEVDRFVPEPAPEITLLVRSPPPDPTPAPDMATATATAVGTTAAGVATAHAGAWLLAPGRTPQALPPEANGWQLPDTLCREVFWDHGSFGAR